MIIWKGMGILILITTVFIMLGTEYAVNKVFNDDQFFQDHGWPKAMGLFLSGLIAIALGKFLDNRSERNSKVMVDKETGAEVTYIQKHSLFFIDIKYWGFILIGGGVISFFF